MDKRLFQFSVTIISLVVLSISCGSGSVTSNQPAITTPPDPSPTTAGDPSAAETRAPRITPTKSPEPEAASQCANALMPLQIGNEWFYEQESSDGVFKFSWQVVDVTEDTAVMEMKSDEPQISASYRVKCSENAILSFPSLGMDILTGSGASRANIEYQHTSGVFLPSPSSLADSGWKETWETEITLNGEASASQPGESFQIILEDSPWLLSWEAQGLDPRSTPAGEYSKAVKISRNSDMTMNASFQGQVMSMSFTTKETQWYAEGVGLIESRTEEVNMNMGQYNLPDVQGSAASVTTLIRFVPAGQ